MNSIVPVDLKHKTPNPNDSDALFFFVNTVSRSSSLIPASRAVTVSVGWLHASATYARLNKVNFVSSKLAGKSLTFSSFSTSLSIDFGPGQYTNVELSFANVPKKPVSTILPCSINEKVALQRCYQILIALFN